MKRLRRRLALLAIATAMISTPAAAELVFWKEVAGWRISRSSDEPSCTMTSSYEGEGQTFLFLNYTPAKDDAYLAISNNLWQSIVEDEKMVLDYHLGGEVWSGVKATGLAYSDGSKGFSSLFNGSEFLTDFALAPYLKIMRGETVIDRLSLKGTKAAVIELSRCAASRNKGLLKDPFAN